MKMKQKLCACLSEKEAEILRIRRESETEIMRLSREREAETSRLRMELDRADIRYAREVERIEALSEDLLRCGDKGKSLLKDTPKEQTVRSDEYRESS